jgi:acyl-CoA thioesterase FadM
VIETRLTELMRVKCRFDYRLLRPLGDAGAEELLAEGHTVLACVGQDHVLRRFPPDAEAVLTGPEVEETTPEAPRTAAAR